MVRIGSKAELGLVLDLVRRKSVIKLLQAWAKSKRLILLFG